MGVELTGVIAAAGSGTRLLPKSAKTSKVLLTIDGCSLLERNARIMKETLKINTIHIITGENRADIEKELGDGRKLGVAIHYVQIDSPENGLAEGLLYIEPYIGSAFCLMLGDEFYLEPGFSELGGMLTDDIAAVCCVKKGSNPPEIRKNYAVELDDGKITRLIEKPGEINNDLLGCGAYLFSREIFSYLKMVSPSAVTGKKELSDAIDLLIRSGRTVRPFFIGGEYVNVNTMDDFNYANYIVRRKRFKQKTVSLVIPTWNEEESIGYVIDDFHAKVDEIIVADNRSTDSTVTIAESRGATVYNKKLKGYGDAIRYGIQQSTGDIIVITEADGSFKSRDLGKLLEYLKDADMVMGTRTTKQLVEQGANMNFLLRLGNVAVAKIIELLWWRYHEPRLTDVGCTYRAIWRDAYDKINKDLKDDGPAFSPEMIIEPIRHYMRIIEVPVSYHGRIGGDSKHSGNFFQTFKTGMLMLFLIFRKKLMYVVSDIFSLRRGVSERLKALTSKHIKQRKSVGDT